MARHIRESSPQIPLESEGTRNRKNGRPLRFLWNLRGPGVEKKGRIFPDSFGVGENIRKRTDFLRLRYFLLFQRNSKKFAFFSLREKRARSRGKYRKKGEWKEKSWISFIQTARHANLMNGFAGACLRRIREIRDRSFPFLMGPDQRSGPVRNGNERSWICSFALRAIRQIRDRSENRMRFSERSSIFPSHRNRTERQKISKIGARRIVRIFIIGTSMQDLLWEKNFFFSRK